MLKSCCPQLKSWRRRASATRLRSSPKLANFNSKSSLSLDAWSNDASCCSWPSSSIRMTKNYRFGSRNFDQIWRAIESPIRWRQPRPYSRSSPNIGTRPLKLCTQLSVRRGHYAGKLSFLNVELRK